MFNWKEFKEGKLAVHCDTAEKANDFLKKCEEQRLKWRTDIKPTTVNYYGRYQKETCYDHSYGSISYCYLGYDLRKGLKIYDWEIKGEQKMKYNIGDKVKIKENLVVYERYGDNTFIEEMGKDKFITIGRYYGNQYGVEENCFLYTDEMLDGIATDYPEIYITTDGKITKAAKLINGKIIKKAIAKCCPEDTFNFDIGAKLALERLDEKEAKNPKFVPHLEYSFGESCGNIGDKTKLTAIFGEKLYVGDVVEIYDTDENKNYGFRLVAKENDASFIMGVRGCNFKNGISGNWQIHKVKSFKDLKDGEIIDGIKAVLK